LHFARYLARTRDTSAATFVAAAGELAVAVAGVARAHAQQPAAPAAPAAPLLQQ
jgi:hypothetical protein